RTYPSIFHLGGILEQNGSNRKRNGLMIYFRLLILFFAPLVLITCQSTKKVPPPVEKQQPNEWITLSINEGIEFQFKKFDDLWSGTFTIYSLNSDDEKIAQRHFVSADDTTWNDFNHIVEFLNLYEIEPQHEIEGWHPDSGELPRRVYAFELF